jgi:hypothetical protein
MSCADRVGKVVKDWAHLSELPDDDKLLSVLWAVSHNAVPFQPDAVRDLIRHLKDEFLKQPLKSVDLNTKDFDPGSIKTVGDLKDAICESP